MEGSRLWRAGRCKPPVNALTTRSSYSLPDVVDAATCAWGACGSCPYWVLKEGFMSPPLSNPLSPFPKAIKSHKHICFKDLNHFSAISGKHRLQCEELSISHYGEIAYT